MNSGVVLSKCFNIVSVMCSVLIWYHKYIYIGKIVIEEEEGDDRMEMFVVKISLWAASLNCG